MPNLPSQTSLFRFGNGGVLSYNNITGQGKLPFLDVYFAKLRLIYSYSNFSTVETTVYTGKNLSQAVSLH